jgi:hypothetical protein
LKRFHLKFTFGGLIMRKTLTIAIVSIFAALHSVLYLLPGPWRSWAIYIEPLEGVILGPKAGFLAALIGSSVARLIKPSYDWMFGVVAEPLGVMVSGLMAKDKWKLVTAIYAVMLTAYFIHPFGRALPLWAILDILVAFALIYPAARIGKTAFGEKVKRLPVSLVLISFISTVADSLTRVFLLIPAGLYTLFFESFDAVYSLFVFGAAGSYVEDAMVVLTSVLVGVPLLIALRKNPNFQYPLT